MDDEQYRQASGAIEQPRCRYEKAIQYGYFRCRHHRRFALGERESLHCTQQNAFASCSEFYALTMRKSGFALGTARMPVHLSFNQAMKVQIGGLRGALKAGENSVIEPGRRDADALQDIADELQILKDTAQGEFENLDFSEIMPQIVSFNLRKGR